MKLIVLALIATVASVKIKGPKNCVTMADSDKTFKTMDSNGNGYVSEKELRAAVVDYMKAHKINPSKNQAK